MVDWVMVVLSEFVLADVTDWLLLVFCDFLAGSEVVVVASAYVSCVRLKFVRRVVVVTFVSGLGTNAMVPGTT
jgi:hypothetical protein